MFFFFYVRIIIISNNFFFRYNTSDNAVEFINDNDLNTFWESIEGGKRSEITIELESVVSISKILMYFQSSLPDSLELEYFSNDSWNTLQYYSIDCFGDFREMANKR